MTISPKRSFWLHRDPLVLASGSETRRKLLQTCGIPFEAIAPTIDERAVEKPMVDAGANAADVALGLARAKARDVSRAFSGRIVLGSDQTLSLGTERFSKPVDRAAAVKQLGALAGKTHSLYTAAALMLDGAAIFETIDTARLSMRDLSIPFIDRYLDLCGSSALSSVGGYQVEGMGVHLFGKIDGDFSTIMGLPLMPILAFFRRGGYILS